MILKTLFGNPAEIGTKAPDFELCDQTEAKHQLSQHLGKWLVLYFYPKDNTLGCTKEACSFRDGFGWFQKNNVSLLGVSTDSIASHRNFSDTHNLPFPVLSDSSKTVSKSYGALSPLGISRRVTFIINPDGFIADRIEWANWFKYADTVKGRLQKLSNFE